MELDEIKVLAAALSHEFGSSDDPYRALAFVTEELGEVASEMNKVCRSGAKLYQKKEPDREKLQEEVGDLLLGVFYLANTMEINVEHEMEAKYRRLKRQFGLDI